MAELLSAREFARRAEVDERQVRRAIARGLLNRGADGLLDARQVHTRWRSPNARTRERGADKADTRRGREELAGALLTKERALANLRALELGVKSGQLIPLAQAQRAMFEQGRSQRDAWMSWPVSIAPVLAAELGVEPDAVLRTLTHLVREHLAELGNSI